MTPEQQKNLTDDEKKRVASNDNLAQNHTRYGKFITGPVSDPNVYKMMLESNKD